MTHYTMQDARDYVNMNAEKGVTCPCCNSFVKIYKRTLTSAMAYGLYLIHRHLEDEEFHLEDFFKSLNDVPSSIRGDMSKLVHWGFIDKVPSDKKEGAKTSGVYRANMYAISIFIEHEEPVMKNVYIRQGKRLDIADGEFTTFHDALNNKFDYDKLMEAIAPF